MVHIYADAATPKEKGTAYDVAVWGKGAVAFLVGAEGGIFYSEKHAAELVRRAKREKALSSPLLELENYVRGVMLSVEEWEPDEVVVFGDCKPAEEQIAGCFPEEEDARALLWGLWEAQIERNFRMRMCRLGRTHPKIVLADGLSRNDPSAIQEAKAGGYVQRSTKPVGWWPNGQTSCSRRKD